jgi:hypothetical protein
MAESVTDCVERIIGRRPISFQQFTEDYKDMWL